MFLQDQYAGTSATYMYSCYGSFLPDHNIYSVQQHIQYTLRTQIGRGQLLVALRKPQIQALHNRSMDCPSASRTLMKRGPLRGIPCWTKNPSPTKKVGIVRHTMLDKNLLFHKEGWKQGAKKETDRGDQVLFIWSHSSDGCAEHPTCLCVL